MGWTKEVWRKQVAGNLFELGSIEFQKEIWLGKIPGYQSDFSEVINRLEGCGIPDFLEEFVSDGFLDQSLASDLIELSQLISATGEYNSKADFEELWQSQLWNKISRLACSIFYKNFAVDLQKVGSPYSEWMKKWGPA